MAASLFISPAISAAPSESDPLPVEVLNPERVASNPIADTVGVVSNNLSATPTGSKSTPVNIPEEQALLMEMAQAESQPGQMAPSRSVSEEWAEQVKGRYSPEQKLNLRTGSNVMVPVAIGLMNRIETSFKSVSVKSSDENAILEVDGGILYVTLNTRDPVGLMLMEEGVPGTAVNMTVVPLDVPPALVKAKISLTGEQLQESFVYQQKKQDELLVEKANEEEQEINRSDRHTERLKEILKTTALGQVPAGFTMSDDDLKNMPETYRSPCLFGIPNRTGQRMVGSRELIDVVLVQNNTDKSVVMREERCMSKDTIAVGLIDVATLPPGAKTEIYIVRDKNWFTKEQKLQTRPSLSGAGSSNLLNTTVFGYK